MKNINQLTYIWIFCSITFCQCKFHTDSTQDQNNQTQLNKVYVNPNYSDKTINPKAYRNNGKLYRIFIYNETDNLITANENINLKPNESYTFLIPDTMGIALNNGIQFFIGETEGLEVIDNRIQVAGLGEEWLDKLNVPKDTDWAFSILHYGEGDPIQQ